MERKAGTATVAVTTEEIRSALGRAKTLSSEEEKALRMRHGVGVTRADEALPRAAGANEELEDELLLIEMQLQRAWRARMAEDKARAARPQTSTSPTKSKIVRALRKKS